MPPVPWLMGLTLLYSHCFISLWLLWTSLCVSQLYQWSHSNAVGPYSSAVWSISIKLYHFDKVKKTWRKSLFPQGKSFKSEKDAIRGFVQLPSGDFIISADNENRVIVMDLPEGLLDLNPQS